MIILRILILFRILKSWKQNEKPAALVPKTMPMSKQLTPYYLFFAAILQILHFFTNANAQPIEARIEVLPGPVSIVKISGRFTDGSQRQKLTFIRSFAGIPGLTERIKMLRLVGSNGSEITYRNSTNDEIVADTPFTAWNYSVDLKLRNPQSEAARVSWLSGGRGLLMIGDLFPIFDAADVKMSVKVVLQTKDDGSSTPQTSEYIFNDAENAVIFVDHDKRSFAESFGKTRVRIEIAGNWLFSDRELIEFSRGTFEHYQKLFGGAPRGEISIRILKFPGETAPGAWQADTRGRNSTIVSSDMPFQAQSIQRLNEQLRHEVFHFWIPNDLNLSGEYSWFYEGFALYSSLKLAVAQNRIRFDDFLDTLSRARAIDSDQLERLSLTEASANRWNGYETYVYARGMVTAFLCDISLLNNSKMKRSTNDLVQEIYSKHKFPNARIDGTAAVLAILRTHPELGTIVEKYILGQDRFEWNSELNPAGLENSNGLHVMQKLNGKQKDLLDALGYNNWRHLSQAK